MKEFSTFHFHAPPGILKEAVSSGRIPEKLLEPLRAIVTFLAGESEAGPGIYYLLSRHEDKEIRDHIGYLVANACSARFSPVYLVDCDYTSPGMSGVVPDPGAMGFLDTILYGTSLGSVAQNVADIRVIGVGSFPVSNRMPFSMEAFEDIESYMRNQSKCIIMSGPLEDDDGNVHPLALHLKKILYVTSSGRGGALASSEPRLQEIEGARVAQIDVTTSGEEISAPAGVEEIPAREEIEEIIQTREDKEQAGPPPAEEPTGATAQVGGTTEGAGEAEFRGVTPVEEGGSSMLPKVITAVLGLLFVVFLIYWFYVTRPPSNVEPPATEELAGGYGKTSIRASDSLPGGEAATLPPETTTEAKTETLALETSKESAVEQPPAKEPVESPVVSDAGAEVSEKPEPRGGEPTIVDLSSLRGEFLVHISSFRTIARAKNDAGYLMSKGFPAFISKVDLGNKGKWFRVYVGPFDTRDDARNAQIKLDELPRVKFSRIAEAGN
jgi:cell division septation protein DedD